MTDQNISYTGNYRLLAATIYTGTKIALNIVNLITNINIIESVSNDSIRGSLKVMESSGVLEDYPIRGEESLFLDIEDPLGNRQYYYLFVYKVDNVITSFSNDRLSYTLHFVTRQRFNADQKRVTAAYDEYVSKIAEEIFNNNYITSQPPRTTITNPNKFLEIENTEGKVKLIIPRMTPAQSIKMLESRAYSSTSPSCSFRFFESSRSFYFVTDEYLYGKAINEDKIFNFSYADNISRDNSTFLTRMANLETFRNTSRVDTFDELHGGTYRNVVISLDINNRVVETLDYNYVDNRDSYFRGLSGTGQSDRHSDTFTNSVFTAENARRMIMVKDYVGEQTGQLRGEQFLPEIAANRLAYFKNLNSITVSASGPGRLDVTCGDFIRVNIPEFRHASENRKPNRQLSGIYMVESVTRSFNKDVYANEYTLVKRNWELNAPSDSSIDNINIYGGGNPQ